MKPLHSLTLKTWKMIYCMSHFVYYMQSYDFLLLFRRPSWIFAHNYFCPRVTEFGDFEQVTTCNKLSYDAKISFWQICSTSNAISPGLTGYIPGAAAPGTIIQIFKTSPVSTISCSHRTCRHQSLKKSIWRFLLFSKRLLKLLTVAASISSWDELFQRLITRWEKKWRRQSQRQLSFTNFHECPRVTESLALLNNCASDHVTLLAAASSSGKTERMCEERKTVEMKTTCSDNDSQRIKYQQSIEFLRSQHQELIGNLHEEIERLKRKNRGLASELLFGMTGD